MLLALQLTGAVAAFAAFALAPPVDGVVRLVAVAPQAPAARIAIAAGARIISVTAGGGIVVRGRRDALLWPLLRAGVLPLATTSSACGERPA